jgi:hypothetical protein
MDTTDASRPKHSRPDHSEHLSLFGPPPIFDGEDMENYDQLLTGFSTAIRPAEIFEDIWVREAHDLTIEVLRLRRLKQQLEDGQFRVIEHTTSVDGTSVE